MSKEGLGGGQETGAFSGRCVDGPDNVVDVLLAVVGDFGPLMAWLGAAVHGLGSLHTTDELIEWATGKPLDPKVFEAHLEARYLGET